MKYTTRIHAPSGSSFITELDSNFKLTKNFAVWELANKKAKEEVKLELWPESITFIQMLQRYRELKNKPITIESGYRTYSWNLSVGGNKNSAHRRMCAVDTVDPGLTYTQHQQNAKMWQQVCDEFHVIGAIGWYVWGDHLEAYSDVFYGAAKFQIRDKR